MILLHADLKDPTNMNDLPGALGLGSNIAPLTDLRLIPSLNLPKPIPLLPKRRLRLGVLDDLLSPNRARDEE
eukprot:191850-Alexandrium_andersonii.AAC.1